MGPVQLLAVDTAIFLVEPRALEIGTIRSVRILGDLATAIIFNVERADLIDRDTNRADIAAQLVGQAWNCAYMSADVWREKGR